MTVSFFGIAGSIHTAESGNTSFAVKNADSLIMVDCSGSPVQSLKKSGLNPECLSALILTHAHIDHIYALPSLLHNLWLLGRKKTLPIYAEKSTLKTAQKLCDIFSIEQKKGIFSILWTELEDSPFTTDKITIQAFDVHHNSPTKGLVITAVNGTIEKKLVYFADTAPMNDYPACVFDADALVHECTGTDEESEKINNAGHCTAAQTANAAQSVRAKKLYICHLPNSAEKTKLCLSNINRLCAIPAKIPELFRQYTV